MKKGPDISRYQGLFPFDKVNIDFAIVRASYGCTKDVQFDNNIKNANVPIFVYCYSYALTVARAIAEANFILSLIKGYDVKGVFFDMEDEDGYKKRNGIVYSNGLVADMCNAFCNTVEDAGYYTGVYASESWFNAYLGKVETKFKKWVANWGNNSKVTGDQVDPNSKDFASRGFDFWQFSSQYLLAGFTSRLDFNYCFNDSLFQSVPVTPDWTKDQNIEAALGCFRGEYGNGNDRKSNLGMHYDMVQSIVNDILAGGPYCNEIALRVIQGEYGNGTVRKSRLGTAYSIIQKRVNKMV